MPTPKTCVLRAPGTNCDSETTYAFEMAGGMAERIHLFRLLEEPGKLSEYQILCIPGGFSYGDDVGAGVVLGSQLRGRLNDAIETFLQADKLVLGICNGFQTLMRSGILPGSDASTPAADRRATLTWNENGQYTALWVTLDVTSSTNVFLGGLDRLELPVAHAEGRIAVSDPDIVAHWQQNGQLALKYAAREGDACATDDVLPYPDNPNGSIANIAGLGDVTGRVLGLMPHPERYLHATQHPQWTRRRLTGEGCGLRLFRNAVEYFR